MSSASLAVAHRPHPDHVRIAALSAAIAMNLAVLLVASRPITPTLLHALETLTPVAAIRFIPPKPKVPPPPPLEMAPLPQPATPVIATRTAPISPPVAIPSDEGSIAVAPVTPPTLDRKSVV